MTRATAATSLSWAFSASSKFGKGIFHSSEMPTTQTLKADAPFGPLLISETAATWLGLKKYFPTSIILGSVLSGATCLRSR